MTLRLRILFFAAGMAFAASLAPIPGMGQTVQSPSAEPAPRAPSGAQGERMRNLDFLFQALKAAPDDATAKAVEDRILAVWLASGSDTADLLMSRVKIAIEAQDVDLAIKLLDAIIEIKPDYVEAWNRRATLHYLKKDFARSLADIRQVLAREPRHFGAMAGLGMILQEFGEHKRALEIFRRALVIHPRMQRLPELIKSLSETVEGRGI